MAPEIGRTGDNMPSHLISIGRVEIGAAWPQKAAGGREYHSVKLDDPKLSAPVSANLFAGDKGDGYALIWSRLARRPTEPDDDPALSSGAKPVAPVPRSPADR